MGVCTKRLCKIEKIGSEYKIDRKFRKTDANAPTPEEQCRHTTPIVHLDEQLVPGKPNKKKLRWRTLSEQ